MSEPTPVRGGALTTADSTGLAPLRHVFRVPADAQVTDVLRDAIGAVFDHWLEGAKLVLAERESFELLASIGPRVHVGAAFGLLGDVAFALVVRVALSTSAGLRCVSGEQGWRGEGWTLTTGAAGSLTSASVASAGAGAGGGTTGLEGEDAAGLGFAGAGSEGGAGFVV